MFSKDYIRKAMLLYAVTDSAWLRGRTMANCVAEAIKGGATCVQLREKDLSYEGFLQRAISVKEVCAAAQVPFLINDSLEVALAVDADGIHVGQEDSACEEVRQKLGSDKIVGVSVQTLDEALLAQKQGADYLGVGALYGTSTKPEAGLVSHAELKQICDTVDIPVVAIGGLNEKTIPSLRGTGVDGVALVSSIFASQNIEQSTATLHELTVNALGKVL